MSHRDPVLMGPTSHPSTDEIGRVVFGAMTFGAPVDETEAASMVDVCRDAGVRILDTSNNFAGGASEEILGSQRSTGATNRREPPRS